MDKQRYMISDAAALVNVESHVLRYWEEELELTVPRNEMGHRYYTKENIEQFMKIKEWKEQGYQLKAIKLLIHNGGREDAPELLAATAASEPAKQTLSTEVEDNTRRMEQFQHDGTDCKRCDCRKQSCTGKRSQRTGAGLCIKRNELSDEGTG